MDSNKKQTAVEFFAESIDSFILTTPQGIRDYSTKLKKCLEYEQCAIKSAYVIGMIDIEKSKQGDDFTLTEEKVNEYYKKADQYFNETYGGNNG